MLEDLIHFNGVSKSWGGRRILDRLNWSLGRGECAVILGPSGSGKSVFLSLLLGFNSPDSGSITYCDELRSDPFRRVAVLFQEDALLDDRTVETNLAIARRERVDLFSGPFDAETNSAIHAALADVGLNTLQVRLALPAHLSGGMRRRVALARCLIREPGILIADEPTSGLDPDTATSIFDLMSDLIERKGMTAVIITHDPQCAARLGRPIYYFTPLEGELRRLNPEATPFSSADVSNWLGNEKSNPKEARPLKDVATPSLSGDSFNALDALGRAVLLFRFLSHPPSSHLLLRYLRQWGLGSIGLVVLIFTLLGVVLQIQAERAIADVGLSNRIPELLALSLTRLAPILTGFLIAGRCGSAITAQTGWMRLSNQDKALRTMRIDPDAAFFPALLWSWLIAMPLLAGVGMMAGWSAAWSILAMKISTARITPRYFVNELLANVDQTMLAALLLKSVLIAAGMAAIAYSGGASPKRSATDVTRAITRGLVLSFVWISVMDTVISLVIPT